MRAVLARPLALLLLLATCAWAQAAYPEKPIRLVVGFPPGGGADYVARQVAAGLSQTLGQTVVVDNKPGASGVTAAAEVARAPADGYTLLLGVTATHAIAPALHAKLPYDAAADFTAITEVGFTPMVLVVNPQTPVKTVGDFIRYASTDSNRATYASAGSGNITHMAAELFVQSTGANKLTHIPYKGSSPAITDLIGGHVTAYFDTLPSALPHIQSGKLRALGVTSVARSAVLPNVPTLREEGVQDYEATAWYALFGPAKLSPEVTQLLYQSLRKVLGSADAKREMNSRGVELVLEGPAHFATMLEKDLARWRRVASRGQIKSE